MILYVMLYVILYIYDTICNTMWDLTYDTIWYLTLCYIWMWHCMTTIFCYNDTGAPAVEVFHWYPGEFHTLVADCSCDTFWNSWPPWFLATAHVRSIGISWGYQQLIMGISLGYHGDIWPPPPSLGPDFWKSTGTFAMKTWNPSQLVSTDGRFHPPKAFQPPSWKDHPI